MMKRLMKKVMMVVVIVVMVVVVVAGGGVTFVAGYVVNTLLLPFAGFAPGGHVVEPESSSALFV